MAKSLNNSAKDGLLNYIKDNVTQLCVCNAEPTTRAEAITTYNIESVSMTSADITLSTSGSNRKLTTTEKDLTLTGTDTCTHIALVSLTELLSVTTTASTLIANDFTVAAFDIEVVDP